MGAANYSGNYSEISRKNLVTGWKATRKRIHQLDFKGNIINTYPSLTAAAKASGTDINLISKVAKGKYESMNGYGWRLA